MKQRIYILVFFVGCFWGADARAQYPQYFNNNDENGLPSNEVYSVLQDAKGFIWFGCDAGLYKFDGVRYIAYKSATQKSKSITELVQSGDGRIYCKNFQSQLFFVENDSLKELKHDFLNIPNIAADGKGNIFVNHSKGIAVYNEGAQKWQTYQDFAPKNVSATDISTKSVRINQLKEAYFLCQRGIGTIANGKLSIAENDIFSVNQLGNFIMECVEDGAYLFEANQNIVYYYKNGVTTQVNSVKLTQALQNRKITNANYLADGNLWICTYKGLIQYDPKNDAVALLYPDFSFSDALIDRENNYWFATLQNGLLRLPNLNFLVWNSSNKPITNDKLTKIATDGSRIYFAAVSGEIGVLHTKEDNQLKTFASLNGADIQCFEYDKKDDCLYFGVNADTYILQNDEIKIKLSKFAPTKSILRIAQKYILASSFGAYIIDTEKQTVADKNRKTTEFWSRQIHFDSLKNQLWIATNEGLLLYDYQPNQSQAVGKDTFWAQTQILSLDIAPENNTLYVLAFDGKIQAIDNQHKISLVATLPDNVQAYKIKYQEQKIYLATNKGLWIFDQIRNQWQTINKLSGLASDNVQDLLILGQNVWLATGKGLQKIPIHSQTETQKALIYLRSIKIDSQVVTDLNDLQLHYNQQLILHPEASNYSSNGNFQYKYQFAHNPNTWDYLPANVNQLVIPNIPLGEFELRLKVIDQHGNDSENTIIIKGFVSPPFWKTQWFFMLCLLVFLAVAYFIFDGNIKRLRKKQAKAIERLQLESELREMQQTALKAQMNPHFIFNVLNSIKSYIYKNDKIKASTYLNSFSDLMRTVLDMSNANSVSLEDELRAIKIYIELEAMMLGDDFSYSINIDSDNISSHTKIPALIIQPYVENAFKHGLKNKTGKKTLQLDVYLSPQKNLIIEITDNGIGRQAAQLLQQQQPHYHQSFATHAIEKRINLINNEGQQYITFAIIDLKTDDNQPAGTKIILTLTLK